MSCSICYEAFDNETEIRCGHSFCKKCIDRWAETNNTCPLCREVFHENPQEPDDTEMDAFLQVLVNYIVNQEFKQCIDQDFMSNRPHPNTIPTCKLFWTALNRQIVIRMLVESGVPMPRIGVVRNSLRTLIYEGPGTQNNPIEV